ncbi:hypothetical protein [Aureibaculum conchae]|uniref:hypothetical protein n=1 Tax=Aureibaculum sp. 2308TA14-22 TaxID=3108392 RepID=UPI00339A7BB1
MLKRVQHDVTRDYYELRIFNITISNNIKMNKNKILSTVAILLIILGIAMIYIGGFYAPKVMLPPIITGIGFFLIGWALNTLKD